MVFGVGGSTLTILLERGGIYSLQGLTREPSHLASALFWFGLIVTLSNNVTDKRKKGILLCVIILLVICRSFAGLLFALALYTLYAVVHKKKFIYSLLALCITPMLLLSDRINYYSERLANVFLLLNFGNASVTSSEHIRLTSIIEGLKVFLRRPLFGAGIGTVYSHGGLSSMLSNMGGIGVFLWSMFLLRSIGKMEFTTTNLLIVMVIAIVVMVTHDFGLVYSMPLLLVLLQIRNSGSQNWKSIGNTKGMVR